jgi:twitching motility protein PilT
MNPPGYNLPDDEPQLPPPSYLNAPPPTVPPGGFPDFTSVPPPPPPGDFAPPFDPSAFPPPAGYQQPGGYQPAGRETYRAPDAPSAAPPFDPTAFAAPAYEPPAFEPAAFDPAAFPAPAYEAPAFDASAFEAPAHDTGFDGTGFAAPSPFDTSAFESVPDDSIPTFDTGAFDAPPFDLAAFDAPPVVPPLWDAPVQDAAEAVRPSPFDVSAPTEETPQRIFEAPAAAAAPTPNLSNSDPSEQASFERVTVASEQPASAAPVATKPPTFPGGELPSRRAERLRLEAEAAALAATTTVEPATLPPLPSFPSRGLLENPVEEEEDSLLNLGQGKAGTDPDLIAALNIVVSLGASDLHVSVGATPLVRIDGALQTVPGFDEWDSEKVTSALHSIMSPEHRDQFENELELDFAYPLSEDSRFRVNIYQQRASLGAAFRLIPTEIKQLSALGIPEHIGDFAQLPRGLVLVTGPTGSGKSTTLAALVDLVNATRADHIVTVEDPIEFMHKNKMALVNQREVGHDTHSFNNALKHVLRQDPDVILIGELRDLETISVALTAAETGHLVFATLHTQDAPQTIDRIIDVFPPHQQGQIRTQLAATLQGVVCQTLVKRATGHGRVVATEVMLTTPAVANLIREGKTFQIATAMQAGGALGMHTMDQHLADLVNAGIITHRAAREKAKDSDALARLIQRADTSATSAGTFDSSEAQYSEENYGGRHQ